MRCQSEATVMFAALLHLRRYQGLLPVRRERMIIATIAVKIYARTAWRMLAVNRQPASTNRQNPSKQSTRRGHIRMTLAVICAALIMSATAAALTFRSG